MRYREKSIESTLPPGRFGSSALDRMDMYGGMARACEFDDDDREEKMCASPCSFAEERGRLAGLGWR